MIRFVPTNHTDAPDRGVLLVVKTTLWMAIYREVSGTFTLMFIGGYNLTIAEVILASVGLAFLMRPARRLRHGATSALVLGFVAIYCISLARGLLTEPYDAITSMRGSAALPAILVWSLFVSPQSLWHDRVRRAIINAGWILAVVVLLRNIAGPSFLMLIQDIDDMSINDGGRPLSSQGAIILASAAALCLGRFMPGQSANVSRPLRQLMHGLALMAAVVLTKQGTSTLAMIAAACIIFAIAPGRTRYNRAIFMVIATLVVGISSIALRDSQFIGELNDSLPSVFQFDLTQRSVNFAARQEVWAGLIEDIPNWSTLSQAIGLPAGQKPTIWVYIWSMNGTSWEVSIHSMYYGLLPMLGFCGLTIYVSLLVLSIIYNIRRAFTGDTFAQKASVISVAWIAIVAILGLSYEIRSETSLLIALALASPSTRTALDTSLRRARVRTQSFL